MKSRRDAARPNERGAGQNKELESRKVEDVDLVIKSTVAATITETDEFDLEVEFEDWFLT